MTDTGFFARDSYIAGAAQTAFTFTFPFMNSSHLKASIDGVAETDFTIAGTILTFGGTVTLAGGELVRIYRESPQTVATLLFQAAAPDHLDATDLTTLVKSLLYPQQEAKDKSKWWWATSDANFTPDIDVANAWIIPGTGSVTITLPPKADWMGRQLLFHKTQLTGAVLLDPDGAETINGESTYLANVVQDATMICTATDDEISLRVSYALPL